MTTAVTTAPAAAQSQPSEPLLLSIDDVAGLLNVSRRTVINLMDRKELGSVHIGRRRLATPAQVESYVNGLVANAPVLHVVTGYGRARR